MTSKKGNRERGIKKKKGRIHIYNGRLSVFRGFRLTPFNRNHLNASPIEKSQVLHEALTELFHYMFVSRTYKTSGRRIVLIRDDFVISKKQELDSKTAPLTSLWVELELDSKLKDLKLCGYSMQLVCNHALEQYFLKRKRL